MTDIKSYRLHVNLSASQARRGLKGLGFGLPKVQTAGRNQAVMIHTVTGQHRQELYSTGRSNTGLRWAFIGGWERVNA